jgi:hypothetical protein
MFIMDLKRCGFADAVKVHASADEEATVGEGVGGVAEFLQIV